MTEVRMKREAQTTESRKTGDEARMSHEQQRIAQWLDKVKFRKKLFGGIREKDVWKKIGELNDMYNVALIAERARYDALLEQQLRMAGPLGDAGNCTEDAEGKEGEA